FVTLIAALICPGERCLRYVNAGHPPSVLWGPTRPPLWLDSTGPLVSPALPEATWNASSVTISAGDRLLLYTDGVSETLADDDGRAEGPITNAIERVAEGGGSLLDAILADVHQKLARGIQPDDLTLLTATIV